LGFNQLKNELIEDYVEMPKITDTEQYDESERNKKYEYKIIRRFRGYSKKKKLKISSKKTIIVKMIHSSSVAKK
jgi:hypothetical protein